MNDSVQSAAKPGALLAQERVRQNLSVNEVASKLRISIRQIEALEADDYDKLPGVTFVRGFMRNYARLLHLDPEPLLQASGMGTQLADLAPVGGVSHQHIRLTPEPRSSGSAGGGRKVLGALAGVAMLALAGWWLWQQWSSRAPSASAPAAQQPLAEDGSVSIPVVIPGAGQGINTPSSAAQGAAQPAASVALPVPAASAPEAASAAPSAPAPSVSEPVPLGVIRFEFSGDARLEVRDKNDFVIHDDMHKPSDITEIQVRPPVGLVIGNAKNVKMQFNGRPIDLTPYTDVSVARFTLSDPE